MKPMQTRATALVIRSIPRAEAGTDTGARLMPGQVAAAYGTSYDGQWVYIVTTAGKGWASAAHLIPAEALVPKPKWRVAKSLETLREQIDRKAPIRRRSHDGTIGDAAHSIRKSDHNPNGQGVVTALDITHDPASGCDCRAIADALVKSRDPRIKYIIWNRAICSSKVSPWKWRPYRGEHPHDKHLHVSVDADPALHDAVKAWRIG